MAKRIKNPPSAKILMNSMRSMGYSFESAVADVIDNSISAKAKNIWVNFPSDPSICYISICDDGEGMSRDALCQAMKYGSCSDDDRDENDLGRFGLGMKSASLSQCRKLTVASNIGGNISAFIWDIDIVGDDWLIQECNQKEIDGLANIEQLKKQSSGTLIIWENFDLIEKSAGNVFSYLNDEIDVIGNYLSLIFHRYLNNDKENKVNIQINEYLLQGLDPFLEQHKKTNRRKPFSLMIPDSSNIEREIKVSPFVLPFQKDLTAKDNKKLGGLDSYNTKQGFYIYRNKRLIIWGTWFRMKPKHELTKNARIRVDIPNTLDDVWGIDIKKQNAVLPKMIRNNLVKAVEEAMNISIKAQRHRGRIANADDATEHIWDRVETRDKKVLHKINRESQIFKLLDKLDDEAISYFDLILDEIEENLPYQQIRLDVLDNLIDDTKDDDRLARIKSNAVMLVNILVDNGVDKMDALERTFNSEPFSMYESLRKEIEREL